MLDLYRVVFTAQPTHYARPQNQTKLGLRGGLGGCAGEPPPPLAQLTSTASLSTLITPLHSSLFTLVNILRPALPGSCSPGSQTPLYPTCCRLAQPAAPCPEHLTSPKPPSEATARATCSRTPTLPPPKKQQAYLNCFP